MQCLDWFRLSLQDLFKWIGKEALSLNPGPLSFSCNQAVPWPVLGTCSLHCILAWFHLWLSFDQPSHRLEFIHASIHSVNMYWILFCARSYSGEGVQQWLKRHKSLLAQNLLSLAVPGNSPHSRAPLSAACAHSQLPKREKTWGTHLKDSVASQN